MYFIKNYLEIFNGKEVHVQERTRTSPEWK